MFKATPKEMESCAQDMNRWFGQGVLRAQIDRTLPLSQTAEAHRLQEQSTIGKSGALSGKIVLTP
jgi:NADPH:quinone reductase-like Zn-dependent oxidoreductase